MRRWSVFLLLVACSEDRAVSDGGVVARDAETRDLGAPAPDAETPDLGGPDAGLPVDPDCDRYFEGLCNYLVRCETWAPELAEETVSICHPLDRARVCASRRSAVEKQRLAHDRNYLEACLRALALSDCIQDAEGYGPPICRSLWVPMVQAGGACGSDEECTGGYCDHANSCPGTCVTRGAPGAACTTDRECRTGGYCDGVLCQALVEPGLNCQTDSHTNTCTEGHYCYGSILQPGQEYCAPNGMENEGCANPWFGAATCTEGLICENGVCRRGGADGDLCSSSMRCGVGLRCTDQSGGNCASPAKQGDPCTGSDQCPPRFACTSGQCAPLPVEEEACSNKVPCRRGSCVSGTCTLSMPEEACDSEAIEPCVDGWCSGTEGTCVADLADGLNCVADLECAENSRCLGGRCERCTDP